MDRERNTANPVPRVEIPVLPELLGSGTTALIAGTVDPSSFAVGLRALCQFSQQNDTGVIVTTIESAERTLDVFRSICPAVTRPSIGVVDATSEQQFVTAVYGETPVVFTPSDLERMVMGLSELTGERLEAGETRHLIVRSLTPILADTEIDAVCNVIDRIAGLRSEGGLGLFGLDYTRHDEATLQQLASHVEHILWVSEEESRLAFELESTRRLA